jgi:hypothetical protein
MSVLELQRPRLAPRIALSQAMVDPHLFGSVFASPSFWPWRTLAKLIDSSSSGNALDATNCQSRQCAV